MFGGVNVLRGGVSVGLDATSDDCSEDDYELGNADGESIDAADDIGDVDD